MQEKQISVSFWYQLIEKNKNFIVRSTWVCLLVFGYSFLFGLIVPASGEAWAYNLTLISGVLTAGFIGLIALAGMGIAAFFASLMFSWGYRNAVKEIGRKDEPQYALPSGMNSDILYIEDTTAPKEINIQRIEHYLQNLSDGCFFGLLAFRNPMITFQDSKGFSWAFNRSDIEKEGSVFDYSKESVNEFNRYAQYFKTLFPAYCAERKIQNGASPIMSAITQIKTSVIVIALLFAPQLFSQKTEMVKNALGATANATPREGAKVVFVFEKGSIERTANGTKSIADLITHNRPATVDANDKGAFIGCSVDGIAVAQVAAVNKQTQTDKPKALFADVTPPVNIALPDSVTAQRQIDGIDKEFSENAGEIERYSLQWFQSDAFRMLTNTILIIFLVLRFISNTATNEARLSRFGGTTYGGWALLVGQTVTFATWILGMLVFVPLFTKFAYHFLNWDILAAFSVFLNPQFLAFAVLILIFFFFERIFDWLIKNPKISNGGGRNNGRDVQPYN